MRSLLRKMQGRKSSKTGPTSSQTGSPSAKASSTTSNTIKQYQHGSIDYSTHVQLLRALPSADEAAVLQCTLHTFKWEELPGFAYILNSLAFSYEAISDIRLDDEIYLVPKSLEVFLRKIRQLSKQILPMFVPALCMRPETIAQHDEVMERLSRLAKIRIDAAAHLYTMSDSELARLSARTSQLPTGKYEISSHLAWNRIHERVPPKGCYPYVPLDRLAGEIRLLRLRRNKTDVNLPPEFELFNTKLEDDMDFIAFSYTWGDDSDQREIMIDGVSVQVRCNLHDILMQMMQSLPTIKEFKYIDCWIDALCINQQDDSEKSNEIRRMSQIYAASPIVHAWLGPATDESTRVLREFCSDEMDLDNKSEQGCLFANRSRIQADPVFFSGVAELLMRPFFTRAWCTQELAMARKVLVMSGPAMAEWDALASLSPAYTDWEAYSPLIEEMPALPRVKDSFFRGIPFARLQLVDRLHRRRKSGRGTTLLSLLLATLDLDSSIAKDKIYSLWSMASDAAELLPEPNYDQLDQQVFFDFTKAWIMKYGRLDILSIRAVQRGKWVEGHLPTWITDWSSRRLTRPFLSAYPSALRDEELDDLETTRLYSAAGETGPVYGIMSPADPHSFLLASGLSCDVIKILGEPNMGENKPFASWYNMVADHRGDGHRPTDVEIDFSDAMYANRDPAGRRMSAPDSHQKHYINVAGVFEDEDKVGDLEIAALFWRNHIRQTIAGRRLAVTHKGHVGLVPTEAEADDEVCILFGCSIPVLFRQGPKGTKLIVGDCYFRRMMDGQMIEEAGGKEHCMTHALPGIEIPAATVKPVTTIEFTAAAAAGSAITREARNQQGIHFERPDAEEDLSIMRLPSGKMMDRKPGHMRAKVPEHIQEDLRDARNKACLAQPTPSEAVRIQPFKIA